MKKIIVCLFLLLPALMYSQNLTLLRAKELLGERFISPAEAGFPDSLQIPFTEDSIKFDKLSWLVPMLIDGSPQYRLIQARYPGPWEKNDTMNFENAERVVRLMGKIRPYFPMPQNENNFKTFFRIKERAPSSNGMEFRKTITYFDNQLLTVDLPATSVLATMKSNVVWYFVDQENGTTVMGFVVLPDGTHTLPEQTFRVLTLVFSTN